PFAYAARKSRITDCRALLKHGANIDWLGDDRLTPLMYAIKQDNRDMVSFLLDNNADVNVRGERGQTVLHIATQNRNEDIFKLILKSKGLDFDARDDNGLTALHHCAKQNNVNFAKRLGRVGASLEMKDKSGR
ncbi:ankyrin repeat-containing domain protein, partial [Phaeosphaeriaceae sp. PMI808]